VASKSSEETPRLRGILERAAKLICANGYEATSMQQIADACGLTKAGLYHHITTKESLLMAIMTYGMDLFEERVLTPANAVADPMERLKVTMARNLDLVTDETSKSVTIILHEDHSLTGDAQREINARKKKYVRFLEDAFKAAIERGQVREVDPTLAAFSMLGTMLWTYKWYRPGGAMNPEKLSAGMIDMFFRGVLPS
jgi:AcrR family transcriptional regulator